MGLFSILFSRRDTSPKIEVDDDAHDLDDMMPEEPEARLLLHNLAERTGALENVWELSEIIAGIDGKVKDDERQTFLDLRGHIEELISA